MNFLCDSDNVALPIDFIFNSRLETTGISQCLATGIYSFSPLKCNYATILNIL